MLVSAASLPLVSSIADFVGSGIGSLRSPLVSSIADFVGSSSKYLILAYQILEVSEANRYPHGEAVRKARGIEAKPPATLRSSDAGDVADSPTQAAEGSEAARPNINVLMC
jgi:hypothetical protein